MLTRRGRSLLDTQVRTPQNIFMQPQRLVVPLFQRPYVWNEERQWEPVWSKYLSASCAKTRQCRRSQ